MDTLVVTLKKKKFYLNFFLFFILLHFTLTLHFAENKPYTVVAVRYAVHLQWPFLYFAVRPSNAATTFTFARLGLFVEPSASWFLSFLRRTLFLLSFIHCFFPPLFLMLLNHWFLIFLFSKFNCSFSLFVNSLLIVDC